jgi:hypothetical protein
MFHFKHLSAVLLCGGYLLQAWAALSETQISTLSLPSPSPSPPPVILWQSKISALRAYVLSQPDQPALKARYGPSIQLHFPDNSTSSCLEIRLLNWDCNYDVPLKMAGVAAWLDSTGLVNYAEDPIWDAFRYYLQGYYVDPYDGWNFYEEVRLVFGACGNRGVQSACGNRWCKDLDGQTIKADKVPKGQIPYLNPSDRGSLCLWLRNETMVQ